MIFEKEYENEMDSLVNDEKYFFFIDSNGNICNKE